MDQILNSIQEYIKSGDYFTDARKWYNFKYITPLKQRSLLFLATIIFTILLILICISIGILLPVTKKVSYAIKSDTEKQAKITNTRNLGDPYVSVVNIMVQNYIKQRETYIYEMLQKQFQFIQNTSTRVVYMQFVNFMDIDNRLSPVMRYQKLFRRSINIISIDNKSNSETIVTFESIAKSSAGEIFEDIIWEATVGFIMDEISLNLSPGFPFNFTVTSYKLKLLKEKSKK